MTTALPPRDRHPDGGHREPGLVGAGHGLDDTAAARRPTPRTRRPASRAAAARRAGRPPTLPRRAAAPRTPSGGVVDVGRQPPVPPAEHLDRDQPVVVLQQSDDPRPAEREPGPEPATRSCSASVPVVQQLRDDVVQQVAHAAARQRWLRRRRRAPRSAAAVGRPGRATTCRARDRGRSARTVGDRLQTVDRVVQIRASSRRTSTCGCTRDRGVSAATSSPRIRSASAAGVEQPQHQRVRAEAPVADGDAVLRGQDRRHQPVCGAGWSSNGGPSSTTSKVATPIRGWPSARPQGPDAVDRASRASARPRLGLVRRDAVHAVVAEDPRPRPWRPATTFGDPASWRSGSRARDVVQRDEGDRAAAGEVGLVAASQSLRPTRAPAP